MVNPTEADALMAQSQKDVLKSWKFLKGRAQAWNLRLKRRNNRSHCVLP